MPIVRVIESCILTVDGIPTAVRAGEPHRTDEPVVQQFPWAFRSDNDVETATAAPGERRNARRS